MANIDKVTGANFECFSLEWDTKYFGVKSARVNLSGFIDIKGQDVIIDFCKCFEFVTISNIGNIKENNNWIGTRTKAFLTDINIQFIKELSGEQIKINKDIIISNLYPRSEEIINIAKNTFLYSRFFNDLRLPKQQASRIYEHWTECAFDKENKYFAVSIRENLIAGYILFSIDKDNDISTVELIAIDKKFRGQRVGTELVKTMESFVYKEDIRKIKVGTQLDNISATQFYHSAGFKYASCGVVYHLWEQKI